MTRHDHRCPNCLKRRRCREDPKVFAAECHGAGTLVLCPDCLRDGSDEKVTGEERALIAGLRRRGISPVKALTWCLEKVTAFKREVKLISNRARAKNAATQVAHVEKLWLVDPESAARFFGKTSRTPSGRVRLVSKGFKVRPEAVRKALQRRDGDKS